MQGSTLAGRGATLRAFVLVLVGSAGALALLAMPRPVAPGECPGLHLDPRGIAKTIKADTASAQRAPSEPSLPALRELYEEHGLAEVEGRPRGSAKKRNRDRVTILEGLGPRRAEVVLGALRAQTMLRFDRWLASERELDAPLMGEFEVVRQRYGLIREGVDVAPPFVTRTLFKARWNAIFGQELTHGFQPVEREAYWGWLALESPAPPTMRRDALGHYEKQVQQELPEARAALLFLDGDALNAAEWFDSAHQTHGNARFRNHALAAMTVAAMADGRDRLPRGEARPSKESADSAQPLHLFEHPLWTVRDARRRIRPQRDGAS